MTYYIVSTGETVRLRTLSLTEAQDAATKIHRETGAIPDLWEDTAPEKDHRISR